MLVFRGLRKLTFAKKLYHRNNNNSTYFASPAASPVGPQVGQAVAYPMSAERLRAYSSREASV